MQLHNFTIQDNRPDRTSGPCEVGGLAALAAFDRPTPDIAYVTVQPPAGPLPAEFAAARSLVVLDQTVPVSVVRLEDGSEALRGSIDPVLVDAVVGAAPSDAGGPGVDLVPEQAQDPGPAPSALAPAGDPLLAACRKFQRRSEIESEARTRLVKRRRLVKRLGAELEEAAEDLAEDEAALALAESETLEARNLLIAAGGPR